MARHVYLCVSLCPSMCRYVLLIVDMCTYVLLIVDMC